MSVLHHDLVDCIEHWREKRLELVLLGTRQEAKVLARLDRWAAEDDLLDGAVLELA